jgi:hypothetical protein
VIPIGPWPHVVARLRGDDKLVAVRSEVLPKEPTDMTLSGSSWGAVVVGEIEVRDAKIKGATKHASSLVEVIGVPEVMPTTQGHSGKSQTRSAAATVDHAVIAVLRENHVWMPSFSGHPHMVARGRG